MVILKTIIHIGILFCFSSFGSILQTTFNIPVPGSIIGFLLLLLSLSCKLLTASWIHQGACSLLEYLPLILIPSTLGIIKNPVLFTRTGVAMMFIVVLSTVLTMVASGQVGQMLEVRNSVRKERELWRKL
ncbi:CidA/LrgA family holin-like protein [Peribacillus sp. NPDC058002]|uniref:CidA/LrgA family holin-like protein n=1 Tax=Peribacillus sp. NPDC058002 TaxID=3346301 RepID=UPI0036DE8988